MAERKLSFASLAAHSGIKNATPSSLKEIRASKRGIANVDPALARALLRLEVLDLRDNKLSNEREFLEAIRPLSGCLRVLDVRGNPFLFSTQKALPGGRNKPLTAAQALAKAGPQIVFESQAEADFCVEALRMFPLLQELNGRAVVGGVLRSVDVLEPAAAAAASLSPRTALCAATQEQSAGELDASETPRFECHDGANASSSVSGTTALSSRSPAPRPELPPKSPWQTQQATNNEAEVADADVVSALLNGSNAPRPKSAASASSARSSYISEASSSERAPLQAFAQVGTRRVSSVQVALNADDIFPASSTDPALAPRSRKSTGILPGAIDSATQQPAAVRDIIPIPTLPKVIDLHGFGIIDECVPEFQKYLADKHEKRIASSRDAWDKLVAHISTFKMHQGVDVYETLALHERRRLRQVVLGSGVPLEHCAALWMACSGALAKKRGADLNSESGAYLKELLNKVARSDADAPAEFSSFGNRSRANTGASAASRNSTTSRRLKTANEIGRDVGRTFRTHYRMNQTVQTQLRRLLEAYARRNKAVGYAQSMNFLTAWPLIICGGVTGAAYDDGRITIGRGDQLAGEEACASAVIPGLTPPSSVPLGELSFWILSTVIEDLLPGFWSPTMTSLHVAYRVISEVVALRHPQLDQHLKSLSVSLPLALTKWILNLFANSLPSETTRHVWSALFVEVCCATGGGTTLSVAGAASQPLSRESQPSVSGPSEAALHFVYRVCLALLHAATPHVLEAQDAVDAFQAIDRTAASMFDWKALLRASVIGAPLGNLRDAVKEKVSRPAGSLATVDIVDDLLLRHLRRKHARELHLEVQELRQRKDETELSKLTHFTPDEIESLRLQFRFLARQRMQSTGCEARDSVNFNFEQFSNTMARTFATTREGEPLLRRLFNAFDRDADGSIDFREMIVGLSAMTQGTVEERLELLFSAMLVDATPSVDGLAAETISKDDLAMLLHHVFLQIYADADGVLQGRSGDKQTHVSDFVEHVMKNLDLNGDGRLSLDEFKKIAVLEPQLVEALMIHGPDSATSRFTEVLESNRELPAWEPDQARDGCPICGDKFVLVRRRKHHCRRCGRVVCGVCSRHNIRVRGAGDDPVRVCNTCAMSFGELRPPPRSLPITNLNVNLP